MKGELEMKKFASLISCLLLIATLFGACGSSPAPATQEPTAAPPSDSVETKAPTTAPPAVTAEPEATFEEHINVIIDNTQIAAINPIGSGGPGSATGWVYTMVYDTLVKPDGEGGYIPNLATSWESSDWKSITFKLRDDIKFTNGEPFTAGDVVFTIEQALLNPGSVAGAQWVNVESAKALDDTTVELTLKSVRPQILFDASMPFAGIMNEKAVTENSENGVWVGTGAFYITAFASNDSVSLQRNEDYWGEIPPTKTMTLRYIPEMSTRLMMLQNGEADICFNLSEQDLELVVSMPETYDLTTFLGNNCSNIGFNMNDPICGDYNFRMAVAHAINRDDIAMGAEGIYAIPETTGTFWGAGTPFRNNDIPIIPHDLEKAQEYLDASSYNGEEVVLTTSISTMIRASEVIQQQLSEIGIKITIKQTDPASFMSLATYENNETQMYCFVGAFSQEPYTSSYGIFYPGAVQNRTSYNNPEIAAILDEVASEADTAKQQELYYKLQELTAEDVPYLNLFYRDNAITSVKGVGGVVFRSDSNHDLRYMFKTAS